MTMFLKIKISKNGHDLTSDHLQTVANHFDLTLKRYHHEAIPKFHNFPPTVNMILVITSFKGYDLYCLNSSMPLYGKWNVFVL